MLNFIFFMDDLSHVLSNPIFRTRSRLDDGLTLDHVVLVSLNVSVIVLDGHHMLLLATKPLRQELTDVICGWLVLHSPRWQSVRYSTFVLQPWVLKHFVD